jgi:hypothetical protein
MLPDIAQANRPGHPQPAEHGQQRRYGKVAQAKFWANYAPKIGPNWPDTAKVAEPEDS